MKILYKKQINFFRWVLLISGLGAIWLSFMWLRMTFGGDSMTQGGAFSTMRVFAYYLFNSFLLLISSLFFSYKYFKTYSVLAIILAISVTVSLFIFQESNNLFFSTVLLGTTMGAMFGGTLLVPMFLGSVYVGVFRAIKHISGKLVYSYENPVSDVPTPQNPDFPNSEVVPQRKSSFHKTIPIVILLYAGVNLIQAIFSLVRFSQYDKEITKDFSLLGLLVYIPMILLITFSFISLKSNKPKVYKTINIIMAVPIVLFLLFPLIGSIGSMF